MKKSTLITTIAMIVVVVVALSTATYAWFSTTEATYANITINIASDATLSVSLNSVNIYSTSDTASFSASDFLDDPDAATGTGIRAGVWVPNQTTAINLKPSADTTSATTIALLSGEGTPAAVNFYKGTLDKSDSLVKGIEQSQMSPDIISVANNMATAKTVTLKIFIGFADNNASRYAASGVSSFVAGTTGLIAETDYFLPNAIWSTGDVANSAFTKHTATTAFTDSEYETNNNRGNHIDSVVGVAVATEETYESASADAKLAKDAGLTTAYFYTLSKTLGTFNQNDQKNYLVYNWLDGAYLSDNAKGATIQIVYAFTVA